jgi:hypothetical protein
VTCPCLSTEHECCQWTGPYNQRSGRDCEFVRFPCENVGCDTIISRRTKLQHITNECLSRMVQCEFCSEDVTSRDLGAHKESCDRRPMTCECGFKTTPFSIEEHKNLTCPLTVMDCPLFKINKCGDMCTGRIAIKKLYRHLTEQTESGELIEELADRVLDLQVELDGIKAQLLEASTKAPPTMEPTVCKTCTTRDVEDSSSSRKRPRESLIIPATLIDLSSDFIDLVDSEENSPKKQNSSSKPQNSSSSTSATVVALLKESSSDKATDGMTISKAAYLKSISPGAVKLTGMVLHTIKIDKPNNKGEYCGEMVDGKRHGEFVP